MAEPWAPYLPPLFDWRNTLFVPPWMMMKFREALGIETGSPVVYDGTICLERSILPDHRAIYFDAEGSMLLVDIDLDAGTVRVLRTR